ncbi:unnamed protein product [Pedinophyceae sp. YPF-701]|nr:unnamed protein product [Pedinophyceae sp. YPF-701]
MSLAGLRGPCVVRPPGATAPCRASLARIALQRPVCRHGAPAGRALRCGVRARGAEGDSADAGTSPDPVEAPQLDSGGEKGSASVPWLPLLVLGSAGMMETGYLTAARLIGTDVSCPLTGGCADVLSSSYASVFGVPLPAFGFAAYGAVTALAAAARASEGPNERSLVRWTLFGTATALVTTSGRLMYLLATELGGELCTWCLTSAALSFGIGALTYRSFSKPELKSGAAPGLTVAAAVLAVLAVGQPSQADGGDVLTELPYDPPVVETQSTPETEALARRLNAVGARMYGAFWCPHCFQEEELFGRGAMKDFPYVECFPEGWSKGKKPAQACVDAGVKGFPTWVIPGQEPLLGAQPLEELARVVAAAEQRASDSAVEGR